ncbi:hypothetical protein F8O01_13005 [Pseudoclavibacter chungangensis]|uniref:Uncharacterized protein n=1 Tax=Pseudoclavibacter chungangensis TaxID=587635 RepID=A0A7J5BPE7_9MICO|nr:hypothetical protein [Pseudoclavibacter chungangensis]KAB1654809.1 hypothetical protein F8O01_13005 [Pseudoclavibacter chungangensis]NYJ68072.1 hypothetical protein [Pseudoclavibacter chungangensis]
MGDAAEDREIVGDEQVAHAEPFLRLDEEVEDLRLHGTSSAETGPSSTMSEGSTARARVRRRGRGQGTARAGSTR